MDGIKTLRLGLGNRLLLDGNNLETGYLNLRQNSGGKAFADRVRLDDAEGAL